MNGIPVDEPLEVFIEKKFRQLFSRSVAFRAVEAMQYREESGKNFLIFEGYFHV